MDKPHVLIIEDDASVCDLLLSRLTKDGLRVSVAYSGEDALSQIEEDLPEVIVLDLNLPGMNGLDVCRVIRQDQWMAKISVLMLTGESEEDDIVAGLETGADDYMTKPFSPKLLVARVKALLRRGTHPAGVDAPALADDKPAKLKIKTLGTCEISIGERRLACAEDFSPAQRQLMSMLVSAPECNVSQEAAQATLWPDSSAKKARSSFDSLLSRVRRTLDVTLAPFDSKQYLVVKRGYLFLENVRIDAHEFRRLIRKGHQQISAGNYWPAEITFTSAFSLWRGSYMPGNFGVEEAIICQDELQQLYLESSQTFARLLAENNRFQQASSLLRDALRYSATNDGLARLLYNLCLAQESPGQAAQVLKHYSEALARDNFTPEEIEETLHDFPKELSFDSWFDQG